MTACLLQTLHNGLLSLDAVRAELDFVHCGSYPLSGMEKISQFLGLQYMFALLMLITLDGPNFPKADKSTLHDRLTAALLSDHFCSIFSFYPFMTRSKLYRRDLRTSCLDLE